MATIDCTLDSFMIPGLPSYQNEFGTKKTTGEGLSTAECVDVTSMPFTRQRPFAVAEDSDTSTIEANSVFRITQSEVTLTLADASFEGCKVTVLNAADGAVTVKTTNELVVGVGCALSLIYQGGWQIENGDYCSNGCFHVYTLAGLKAWAAYMEAQGDYSVSCILHNSLDLAGVEWTPIGTDVNPYTGLFEGAGHAITNLTVDVGSASANIYAGFFCYLGSGAEVKNLSLVNCSIRGGYVGGIAGLAENAEIKNCHVSGNIEGEGYVGGIAGECSNSTISSCSNTGTGTSNEGYAGGIAGECSNSTISSCSNEGDASGMYVGGIAGDCSNSTISSCSNEGDASGMYVGGIAGECYGSSENKAAVVCCINKGTATGSSYSGGIYGHRNDANYVLVQYNTNIGSPTSEGGN